MQMLFTLLLLTSQLSRALIAPVDSGNPESVTLDILSESNSTFKTAKCELDDAPSLMFAPAFGYRLDKIVAGDTLVWECKNNVHVALLNVHLKDGVPQSAFLLLEPESGEHSSKNLVLKEATGGSYAGAKWEEANQQEFGDAVRKVRKTPHSVQSFTLDIGKNDNRWASLELQNMRTLAFIPHSGFHATKVCRGEYSFWEGKPGERCISAFLVDNRELHLILKYNQEKEWTLTFTCNSGTWISE
ncbi:signal peptide-containing protein [Theileria equi strain WA]|uniref:Signal peptide-containing protein n=1 Tax=Theileria equi strain WA TaxID=1537102 RepID=L0AZF3_THEEQ|nr:signal peptide-containing protein [Theileria equi strain WA]AFZ80653.1 signal peptide-containing protein [Theileria equi strain WA]|eukprot:XP_004830319.1 signal peptide-containing protein [Theileria equi strain WA]